jgi:hypothetical protein
MDGLLRLSATVWVKPAEISAVTWETPVTGGALELRVYHPAALADYFVVNAECVFDVVTALGIERPPAAAAKEGAEHGEEPQ